jgi:hypothetical protein
MAFLHFLGSAEKLAFITFRKIQLFLILRVGRNFFPCFHCTSEMYSEATKYKSIDLHLDLALLAKAQLASSDLHQTPTPKTYTFY